MPKKTSNDALFVPRIIKETNEYLVQHKERLEGHIDFYEKIIIKGRDRDENKIPIYLTKCRVKSQDSIYLKLKRNPKKNLSEIQDILGIRVLCLFNQNLIRVFEYLVEEVIGGNSWEELRIYNFADESSRFAKHRLVKEYRKQHPGKLKVKLENKRSGYKSIHFILKIIGDPEYYMEIQLRTLLQDVWGELEHALSYKKGPISTQIRDAFRFLHGDFENMGTMLAELKDIADKDQALDTFQMKNVKPYSFFWYERTLLPKVFSTDRQLAQAVKNYHEIGLEKHNEPRFDDFAKKIRKQFNKICDLLRKMELKGDEEEKAQYWIDMEESFCLFCERDFEGAINIYKNIVGSKEHKPKYTFKQYIPSFRLGELNIIQGCMEEAIQNFDMAEEIFDELFGDGASRKRAKIKRNTPVEDKLNYFYIKMKLANIYWALGSEYIDISYDKIMDAESVFKQIPEENITEERRRHLINNLCWYNLEKFVHCPKEEDTDNELEKRKRKEKREKLYENANNEFQILRRFVSKKDIPSNFLDTAAWFCYQSFRYKKRKSFLEMAVRYSRNMWVDRENRGVLIPTSISIQREHIREIMREAEQSGIAVD